MGVVWAFFPLDEQLGLKDGGWSEGLVREAVWLSGRMGSYEQATEVMHRIGRRGMSQGSIWRRVEKWGQALERVLAQQRAVANCIPNRGTMIRGTEAREGRLGGAMDGAMVHIRDEGWKELKIGCVFEIETELLYDEQSQETVPHGRAVNNSYVAYLGKAGPFGQRMWAEAKARDWERYYDTQIIGDGAPWIWNLADEHFFDSLQTLDWGHATEHLYQAADLLYPQNPDRRNRWLKQAETRLFQGHAEQLVVDLHRHANQKTAQSSGLRTAANYFDTHKRRTQYLEFREEGYVIGSGMVESEAKQYKARFTGPGMRWSRTGLNHLLPVRTAIMSNQFDLLWQSAFNSPQN